MANSFGTKWTFTGFGESHGAAVGGVLDGVPAGLRIDLALIRSELDKRAGRFKDENETKTRRKRDDKGCRELRSIAQSIKGT